MLLNKSGTALKNHINKHSPNAIREFEKIKKEKQSILNCNTLAGGNQSDISISSSSNIRGKSISLVESSLEIQELPSIQIHHQPNKIDKYLSGVLFFVIFDNHIFFDNQFVFDNQFFIFDKHIQLVTLVGNKGKRMK